MIGSKFCWLSEMDERMKEDVFECTSDLSGYFVIKGVEKVILM